MYIPKRDKLGRFKNFKFRKAAWKLIKFQLIALSVLMNVFFVRHTYVIRCGAGGMFMTQQKCGDIAQNRIDSVELDRQNRVAADSVDAKVANELANNQDLRN